MLPTSLLTCDLTRELGYFNHKYMLIVFLFAEFRSVRYVLQLCGPWAKVAYLHFISSLCALHIYECHQLYQILFILSISKSIFYSVPVNQFSLSVPVQQIQYILSVSIFLNSASVLLSSLLLVELSHLVLFTIPDSTRGVPVVGPSSSV